MKRHSRLIGLIGIAGLVFALGACANNTLQAETKTTEPSTAQEPQNNKKIFVALEGDGAVAVIDLLSMKLSKKIKLDSEEGQEFMAHNVQVAPDGKSIWVTANAMEKGMHGFIQSARASEMGNEKESQIVIIDPVTESITKRISLGSDLDLAHVVLSPDSKIALATSQKKGAVFVINTETNKITKKIKLDAASEPHGARILPDGNAAYVALLKGKGMAKINLQTFEFELIPLNGSAVQTAITPDGKKVFVSLYDTKKIAVYSAEDKSVKEINLPEDSRGPLQLYPTPDSRFMYVADQGYYFKQPEGSVVYKIDIQTGKLLATIPAGKAPHGVVVSEDGKYVFVSNLVGGDVSVIDTASDTEVSKIRVGKEPNGISYWSSK